MPSPCSTLGYYILALNPSTVSEETVSVVRPFQATIVLGKNEFLKPSVVPNMGGEFFLGRYY